MIFADTNIFIRYLVEPVTEAGRRHRDIATVLLTAVERGDETITTTEVVIHEICYVLGAESHYGLSAQDIVSYVTPILKLRGFRLPRGTKRSICVRWSSTPSIRNLSPPIHLSRRAQNTWEFRSPPSISGWASPASHPLATTRRVRILPGPFFGLDRNSIRIADAERDGITSRVGSRLV